MGAFTTVLLTMLGAMTLMTVLSPRYNYRIYRWLIFHPYPYEPGSDMPPAFDNAEVEEVYLDLRSGKRFTAGFTVSPMRRK